MKILHIIDRESVTGNTPTDLLAEQRIDIDASLDAYADACREAVLAEYPGADYEVRFDSHCGEDTVMVGDEPDEDTEQDIREIASRVYARHEFWRYLPTPAYNEK